ncbi:MAG TPA: 2-dehydropantoate 2-reductase [Acidimicrobiales bacterium]|nr:2-dehydropantoate 2-reductase [Acidimicrobiales bacterium]
MAAPRRVARSARVLSAARRFVIYGAGAIGGVVGAQLFRAGTEVVLIARGAHAAAMQQKGITLEHGDEEETFFVPVVTDPSAVDWRDEDVVLLTMKSQDTSAAVRALAAVAPPSLAVVCAQNGVDNERVVLRHFDHTYGCVVMMPAAHLEPGVVQAHAWPTPGLLDVGRYPRGRDGTAHDIVAAFNAAGFHCVVRDDVMRWKYTKLLMNLANAIVALSGSSEEAGQIRRAARREGMAVLDAAGIDYASEAEDRERRADHLTIVPIKGEHRLGGSTHQSLARGAGDVETDWLNGEIVLLGRLHGVPTPVNAALQRLANEAARAHAAPESIPAAAILEQM